MPPVQLWLINRFEGNGLIPGGGHYVARGTCLLAVRVEQVRKSRWYINPPLVYY